ncbi:MAG: alpha/beta fold hydrolase [Acidobacteriota bacterium]|nr:MAG: alpha/beta fold hydrolase [Acidobacteriota bacterium]
MRFCLTGRKVPQRRRAWQQQGRAGLVFLAALCCAGCLVVAVGHRVEIGQHRLRVHVAGEGSPAVVMEAGLGETLETWSRVWPEVARFTRVCVYDRAGLGRSDPGPRPRSSERIVEELRLLLARKQVQPPYVLVGHSFGGLIVRLFAGQHPAEVAGLVLIDPTPLDFPFLEGQLLDARARARRDTVLGLAPQAAREEARGIRLSAEQVRHAGSVPDVPIVVLSSARPEEPPAFRAAWRRMQQELVGRIEADEHEIVEDAGHYLQVDVPHRVVDAIQRVVTRARDRALED